LFTRYARLLVLRVDLEYQSGNVIHNEQDRLTKYQEASNDRKHFFNNMDSNKLFEHLVGIAWTLEYGVETGFHYHMVLIYDGSEVREDETLAYWVGKYWSCNITEGQGRDYNCNAKKNKYRELGIGTINYYDTALREGLYHAIGYLMKTDHLALMLIPKGCRTFGRGEELATDQPKMGRPRSHS
ncbi:MAG: inovirus-type Gp2 protein, partial [bacterium]|nr:inovirus-type Gp2 protein [bacterium]